MRRCLLIALVLAPAVTPAADTPAAPPLTIDLQGRQAWAALSRVGFRHTGGGNIDVQQPSADSVAATLTGVAVAGGHPCKDTLAALAFDLAQEFEIKAADAAKTKQVKVTMEARLIGLLRSHHQGGGSASII